jgi:glycosyltransferase involved in cell wall biosynthesis
VNGSARRPRVSVLLPCRDAEAFLPECIESLRAQTLEEHEVLAVDDGSTDGTPDLLREWAADDARVRLLRTVHEEGLVAALRLAAAAARAPLLARMDADDIAAPERLERQVARLTEDRGLAACGTGVELFPEAGVGEGYARYGRWLNSLRTPDQVRRDLLVECPLAHPTLYAGISWWSARWRTRLSWCAPPFCAGWADTATPDGPRTTTWCFDCTGPECAPATWRRSSCAGGSGQTGTRWRRHGTDPTPSGGARSTS